MKDMLRGAVSWLAELAYNIAHNVDARDEATKARDAARAQRTAEREALMMGWVAPARNPHQDNAAWLLDRQMQRRRDARRGEQLAL